MVIAREPPMTLVKTEVKEVLASRPVEKEYTGNLNLTIEAPRGVIRFKTTMRMAD